MNIKRLESVFHHMNKTLGSYQGIFDLFPWILGLCMSLRGHQADLVCLEERLSWGCENADVSGEEQEL